MRDRVHADDAASAAAVLDDIGWSRLVASALPMSLATPSTAPPAANGTTRRIARSG
jgi:hypothetical protein